MKSVKPSRCMTWGDTASKIYCCTRQSVGMTNCDIVADFILILFEAWNIILLHNWISHIFGVCWGRGEFSLSQFYYLLLSSMQLVNFKRASWKRMWIGYFLYIFYMHEVKEHNSSQSEKAARSREERGEKKERKNFTLFLFIAIEYLTEISFRSFFYNFRSLRTWTLINPYESPRRCCV